MQILWISKMLYFLLDVLRSFSFLFKKRKKKEDFCLHHIRFPLIYEKKYWKTGSAPQHESLILISPLSSPNRFFRISARNATRKTSVRFTAGCMSGCAANWTGSCCAHEDYCERQEVYLYPEESDLWLVSYPLL